MTDEIISVDARNLLCPMPVIKTQNAVLGASAGQQVHVSCTDPGAKNDIPAWCRINGHILLSIEETENGIIVIVEVGE